MVINMGIVSLIVLFLLILSNSSQYPLHSPYILSVLCLSIMLSAFKTMLFFSTFLIQLSSSSLIWTFNVELGPLS